MMLGKIYIYLLRYETHSLTQKIWVDSQKVHQNRFKFCSGGRIYTLLVDIVNIGRKLEQDCIPFLEIQKKNNHVFYKHLCTVFFLF